MTTLRLNQLIRLHEDKVVLQNQTNVLNEKNNLISNQLAESTEAAMKISSDFHRYKTSLASEVEELNTKLKVKDELMQTMQEQLTKLKVCKYESIHYVLQIIIFYIVG